ncbi:ABC transporter permease subunit [Ruminococcaceae bacterium OttesenSCG-928-L11]|nr:ABC transporter permease subunit [Ruminococcaceae bacterium OttesenSCG-928-L11]
MKKIRDNHLMRRILVNWQLYLFVLPAVLYFLLFHILPLFGLQIAFRDYRPARGFFDSTWVGLKHFTRFFNSYYFVTVMRNTLTITILTLIMGFPLPILLALLLNELPGKRFSKVIQTVSFAPHFISVVVLCGIIILFLNPSTGMLNHLLRLLGMEPVNFLGRPELYKWVHVISGVWQETGWASVIYFAALAGVDLSLHEAARIDGANKFQRMVHINFPVLVPIIVVLLIMRCGSLLSVGYEKVYLLQNDMNVSASEVISTYVYKAGLINNDYSFSTAVGLFNSVINCIMLVLVNGISRKFNESSLW